MGQDLVFFFGVECPWALGAFPCLGVMVTAADRAAAALRRVGRERGFRSEGS